MSDTEPVTRDEMLDWLRRHRVSAEVMAAAGPLGPPRWEECWDWMNRQEFDEYAAQWDPDEERESHRSSVVRLAVVDLALTVLGDREVS